MTSEQMGGEAAAAPATPTEPKRPGVVTFIGVVLGIQAALAAVTALAIYLNRDNAELQSQTGQTSDELVALAVIKGLLALVLFLVGFGIISGARWARMAVAIVYGFLLAISGWYLVTHLGGGVQWSVLLQAGIAIFVLWALFGNDKSEAFFGDRSLL